jgi:hypothetical protein
MRVSPWLPVASVAAWLPATPLAAQTGPEPTFVLSILVGYQTGHGLWRIPRQPYLVLNTNLHDTLRLSRTVGPGFAFGASGTYFVRTGVGIQGEVVYVPLPLDNSCEGLFYHTDAEHKNEQLCNSLNGASSSNGAVLVAVGLVLRAASRGRLSPYVRASLGYAFYSGGTIETVGTFTTGAGQFSRQVYADAASKRGSVAFRLGGGITAPLGPGYGFHMEVGDNVLAFTRATAPSDALGVPPTDVRYYHRFFLVMGLDIVLERHRGRRY